MLNMRILNSAEQLKFGTIKFWLHATETPVESHVRT